MTAHVSERLSAIGRRLGASTAARMLASFPPGTRSAVLAATELDQLELDLRALGFTAVEARALTHVVVERMIVDPRRGPMLPLLRSHIDALRAEVTRRLMDETHAEIVEAHNRRTA